MSGSVDDVRSAIAETVGNRGAELVAAYYKGTGSFAGRLFDELGANPQDKFTSDDLVAASLLDVRFDAVAVRAVLVDPERLNQLLSEVGPNRPLWEVDDLSAANALWKAMREVPIGRTRVSKLLARKRPDMLPILDSVISVHLGLEGAADRYVLLREALVDETIRAAIDEMAPAHVRAPSTLRLLDVAVWMRYSESQSARRVRGELGLPVAER